MSWSNLAIASFDHVEKYGGTYHIWGHSWEIEKYHMWNDLEAVFQYVGNRSNCEYVNNAFLSEMANCQLKNK